MIKGEVKRTGGRRERRRKRRGTQEGDPYFVNSTRLKLKERKKKNTYTYTHERKTTSKNERKLTADKPHPSSKE